MTAALEPLKHLHTAILTACKDASVWSWEVKTLKKMFSTQTVIL